jgi:protein gp37
LKKPQRIFVCSMGDLFHPRVPWEFIAQVFAVMMRCSQHEFQVLTKRPGRMAHFANVFWPNQGRGLGLDPMYECGWPSNVWAGTSVESAKYLHRLDVLARVPAKVRFVSLEPLLGHVDLEMDHWLDVLHWVILGSESGPNRRPIDEDWVRSIRDQCNAAGVPFFYKQVYRNGRRITMPLLDGKEYKEWPT